MEKSNAVENLGTVMSNQDIVEIVIAQSKTYQDKHPELELYDKFTLLHGVPHLCKQIYDFFFSELFTYEDPSEDNILYYPSYILRNSKYNVISLCLIYSRILQRYSIPHSFELTAHPNNLSGILSYLFILVDNDQGDKIYLHTCSAYKFNEKIPCANGGSVMYNSTRWSYLFNLLK